MESKFLTNFFLTKTIEGLFQEETGFGDNNKSQITRVNDHNVRRNK